MPWNSKPLPEPIHIYGTQWVSWFWHCFMIDDYSYMASEARDVMGCINLIIKLRTLPACDNLRWPGYYHNYKSICIEPPGLSNGVCADWSMQSGHRQAGAGNSPGSVCHWLELPSFLVYLPELDWYWISLAKDWIPVRLSAWKFLTCQIHTEFEL